MEQEDFQTQSGEAAPSLHVSGRPAVSPALPGRTIAALDLGTNNCRLLVAQANGEGFRVVESFSRIVRLGEGLAHSGRLSERAEARAISALKVCAEVMRRWGVSESWVVATEACRRAENGAAFAERVKAATGLTLDIITPAEEARLAVEGCAELIDPAADGALVFDIGGGSTELIWVVRDEDRVPKIAAWVSLPVGVVSLAERFDGVAPTPELYRSMVASVRERLAVLPDLDVLRPLFESDRVHHLGISGTVTTLAGLHLGLRRYVRHRIDGIWMSGDDVTSAAQRMRLLSWQERADHGCIGTERADLVIPGCAILDAIRDAWPTTRLRVADRGLREGMLMALVGAPVERRPRRRVSGRRRRRGRGGAAQAEAR